MKLTLVLVHGIGSSRKTWADKIIPAIERRLKSKLKNLLGNQAPATLVYKGSKKQKTRIS